MTPGQLIDTLLALHPLSELPRTGWVLSGVASPESVAAHSYAVAVCAMGIVDALREAGESIDGEAVLRFALLHDAAEVVTGDIPGPAKTAALKSALAEVEADALARLLPAEWSDSAAGSPLDSRVAEIVHAADKVQMLAKALSYEQSGRGQLSAFWEKKRSSDIPFVDALHAELRSRRDPS
ncbi:MAG: putative hydrolase of HD superfamily [Polyangiales bacterium]|jgi:putative hydrolase of HD superfamily